jgi:hypothetical protein
MATSYIDRSGTDLVVPWYPGELSLLATSCSRAHLKIAQLKAVGLKTASPTYPDLALGKPEQQNAKAFAVRTGR